MMHRTIPTLVTQYVHCPECGYLGIRVHLRKEPPVPELGMVGVAWTAVAAKAACGCALEEDALARAMREAERQEMRAERET